MSQKKFLLDPLHDSRHSLPDDPLSRESLVFMLQLPEHNLAAFVYTWVSGQGKAGAAFCLYGPAIGKEPIFEAVDGIPVPRDQGFDDWRVGGVHVRHRRALEEVDVTFQSERASLEYNFVANHAAYNYGSHADGCPKWFASDRFEQSGHVRGTLRIGDKIIPFDTTGHRDHSWGTRDWGVAQHWRWVEAQAGDDVSVHFFEVEAVGVRSVRGYVDRDSRIAEVVDVRTTFELDGDMLPLSIVSVVVDDLGRSTMIRGTSFANYEFKVSPLATLNEVSMAVEIDGRPGVGHIEMMWPKDYLAYMRSK